MPVLEAGTFPIGRVARAHRLRARLEGPLAAKGLAVRVGRISIALGGHADLCVRAGVGGLVGGWVGRRMCLRVGVA